MAKKKNKKNTQKQVEVVSPPEELKAVNTTATEEPSANEEAEQQLPPPPVDAPTNNEIPVAGSTSIPDHDLEASQDTPSEDQTSMVAEALHNGETAEPSVDDHVHMSEASPEEEPVEPITDAELVAPVSEPEVEKPSATEPHKIEEVEQPLTELPDDSQAVPEDVLGPEAQDEPAAPEVVEPTPTAVVEDPITESEPVDTSQTEVDAPLPVDLEDGAVHLEDAASTEPDVAAVQEETQHDLPSLETQVAVEEATLPAEAPEVPAIEPHEHDATPPLQAEDVHEPQPVSPEVEQPIDAVPEDEVPVPVEEPLPMPLEAEAVEVEQLADIAPDTEVSIPVEEPLSEPLEPAAAEAEPTEELVAPTMDAPEPPANDEPQSTPEPPSSEQIEAIPVASSVEADPLPQKETKMQRRARLAEEEQQREEQERLDQQSFEQYRIDQERLEMARLEQKRLERERMRQERMEKERVEQERLQAERLQNEKIEQDRLEAERLIHEQLEAERVETERLEAGRAEEERLEAEERENERLDAERQKLEIERIEQDRLEQERVDMQRRKEESENRRIEQQKIEKEGLERRRLEQEAAAAAAAEVTRNIVLQAEASRKAEIQDSIELSTAIKSAGEVGEEPTTRSPASSASQAKDILKAATAPTQLSTPPPDGLPQPSVAASDMRTSNPVSRVPTPAVSVGRTSSPRSVTADGPKSRAYASEHPPHTQPSQRSDHVDPHAPSRRAPNSPALPAPKPQAVSQVIQDNRPPAPSPPVGRMRPRHLQHAPAFDSEDDSDASMVRPRRQFRGGEEYPSGSANAHRSGFASRVPAPAAEPPSASYSHPPPPSQQPPGYHPGWYPPTAPPHYQNHNYRVSQQGYPPPNAYGPSSHSSSSPYTEPWNYPPGYRHDSPPQRHDTLVTRDYPLGLAPLDTRAGFGDDPGDVFSRIAQAIPDLHVLLARYKETHGQLSVREELLRRSSIEQEERLRVKDDEIAELKERARDLEHKYSTEASRSRLQFDRLEEQARELQDQRAETEKFKKEAQDNKVALDIAMKSWETKYAELAEAHAILSRTAAEEKASFEEWRSSLTTRTDAEKIALAIQFDKRLKEADVIAENQRHEAAAAFAKEKEELIADFERRHLERQEAFDQERHELETKLAIAQQDHDDAIRHERESRDAWIAEREALIKSHRDDRESIRSGWDEQRDALEAQYKKSKDESDRAWIELHADASKRAEEENAKVNQLIKEKEELQKRYNALRAESEQEKAIIKSVATNLESEKSRLEKLMECYGDIAEIKSKGDTYYSVSFSQLQKQIIDLAATHFVHLPVRPPADDLAQVPSNLPSFLGDTAASRQVRAAYIAHTVSKLITYRVFGPFLFSLGRRYDKADSLFLSMSHHIRDKSTRKEAIWRQQTLLAAFTSSGAKQRINTAAGTVVEEIVSAIKHFADPREEEGIKIAVKRIVKLAAETWRFARLEREMINATMPALLDEEHQFTGPEYWPSYESYKPEGTLIGSLVGTSAPADEKPQLLLRLFPVIWREAKHENFHVEGEKPDDGCVYHNGLALYDDAESVVQRMDELKSAGLPSYTTTASPTIAEDGKFPPPIVPPPREAPPSLPATAEKSDRSTTESLERSPVRKRTPPPPPSSIPSLDESTPSTFVKAYRRPPPGPIDFASPRDLIGLPPPVESAFTSHTSQPKKKEPPPVPPKRTKSMSTESADRESMPPPPPPSAPPPPPPVIDEAREPRQFASVESAILPATFPEPSPSDKPPTPPHSRSGSPTERPISPLFEAIDEIESLQSHRIRPSSKSLSRRRSTHSRKSKESNEMPDVEPATEQTTRRRTSGYALSTKSAKTVDSERTDRSSRTEKSEKTERTEKSERDPKSRYMCESRSAAVKALYPNSPMAMQNSSSSSKGSGSGSVSSSKKKDRDSKELKREKSFADNTTFVSENTWDTTSIASSKKTDTSMASSKKTDRHSKDLDRHSKEFDRHSKEFDRHSKELKHKKSFDNSTFISVGTWDTNSEVTSLAAVNNTHVSSSRERD